MIADSCGQLDAALSAEVEKWVIERAPEQTVTNLRRSLARAIKAVDRRGWDERHQQAIKERDVSVTPHDAGMSQLWSLHTTADAEQILAVLQIVANRTRGDGRRAGEWFRWSRVGLDGIGPYASAAGLAVRDLWTEESRWFADLAAAP